MKLCTKCKERLAVKTWCTECTSADNLARYHRNKGSERGERHRLAARKSWLKTAYGLTYEEYLEMFRQQRGACKICNVAVQEHGKDRARTGHVDHCHTTGKVRGILCKACNTALGAVKDNVSILRAAIQYLEDSR